MKQKISCTLSMAYSESKSEETKDDDDSINLKDIVCVKAIANSIKLKKLSSGLFRMHDNCHLIEIIEFVGNSSWFGIGHIVDGKLFVFKEEMLYLLECGCCELSIEHKSMQTVIGWQNAFCLFFSLPNPNEPSFHFSIYSVFKKLKFLEFVVKRSEIIRIELPNQSAEFALYFEEIYFWIWKRGTNQFWKSIKECFHSNSIQSIASALNKIYKKKPDALVLIQKDTEMHPNKLDVNLLHSLTKNIDKIPIFIASVSQNDVLLFEFGMNSLLN